MPDRAASLASVALGSNLSSAWGDCAATLHEAVRRIGVLGDVRAVSRFYHTEPVGFFDQPQFLNAALLLETKLAPLDLLHELLATERAMGRERVGVPAKGPRVIDLDLLLLGNAVLTTAELTLPHPAMAKRRFVLEPLAEIAPEMRVPGSGLTIREMLARLG